MQYTIEKMLENKTLKGIRIVAGEAGMGNSIYNTNIMDNPDTFDWLLPGDFVLTTGYVFKDDVEFQKKVIRELAEINCAGLGVKTRNYFGTMPEEMVKEAEKIGFPLIELPEFYSLAQCSNAISKEINKAQDTLIEKTLFIHENLTDITLSGGSIDEITGKVAQTIGNPIIVVDNSWGLLSYSDLEDNPHPLKEILNLKKRKKVFPLDFYDKVPQDAALFKKSIKRSYKTNEDTIVCRIMPIKALSEIFGYIIVWETMVKLQKIDYIVLERAAIVAALDRIKAKEVEEARHQIRRDFFDDLLAGKIESLSSINNLAELHGMESSGKYFCIVTRLKDKNPESLKDNPIVRKRKVDTALEQITKIAEDLSMDRKINLVSIQRGMQVVLFYPISQELGQHESSTQSKAFSKKLYDRAVENLHGFDLQIGIGQVQDNVLKLNFSFEEAQEAIRLGKSIYKERSIFHFDDFMVYNLLGQLSKHDMLKFYQSTIEVLVDNDRENQTNLVETLDMYFLCQGNIADASKNLFIHRNTLIYRLDKISGILGLDMKNSEVALGIQLGLKIMKILNIKL